MKLLIQKTNETKGNIKKIELTSSDFENNTNTYVIKENESPIIYLTDTQSSYFIDDIDSKLERINSETIAIITMDDLISLSSGTGRDSRPYKVYTALLSQSGTNAPVATVLENTLGDIVWSRDREGEFYADITGNLFTSNKTFTTVTNIELSTLQFISIQSENQIYIEQVDSETLAYIDNMYKIPVEIRVYN